jgi:hypothetical protein
MVASIPQIDAQNYTMFSKHKTNFSMAKHDAVKESRGLDTKFRTFLITALL